MKTIAFLINGIIIAAIADYDVFHDWQAWVMIFWFAIASILIEENTKKELRNKMLPTLDRISDRLNSWKR